MAIVIKKSFRSLRELELLTRAQMREIGTLAIERIKRRTLAGQSVDGGAFRDYSTAYAKRKADELGTGSTVDLSVSGEMLNAIAIVDVTAKSVTLGFTR